jgi:hypothetical protein
VLQVELGGGTGGIRRDAGVLMDVVTLLRDLDDVDMGVGDAEAITLDAIVVVRDDTEDTVVDFGWQVAELLLEIERGEEGPPGVLMGLAVGDLVAIDMASDIVPTTEGVGVPSYDLTMGVGTDGVDTRALEGRDDGKGGRDEYWTGDDARGTVAYSVELGHLMALEYSVELSTRSGVAYWDPSVRIVGIDDID